MQQKKPLGECRAEMQLRYDTKKPNPATFILVLHFRAWKKRPL